MGGAGCAIMPRKGSAGYAWLVSCSASVGVKSQARSQIRTQKGGNETQKGDNETQVPHSDM